MWKIRKGKTQRQINYREMKEGKMFVFRCFFFHFVEEKSSSQHVCLFSSFVIREPAASRRNSRWHWDHKQIEFGEAKIFFHEN